MGAFSTKLLFYFFDEFPGSSLNRWGEGFVKLDPLRLDSKVFDLAMKLFPQIAPEHRERQCVAGCAQSLDLLFLQPADFSRNISKIRRIHKDH